MSTPELPLSDSELIELGRWNTPTIYNGWEQITDRDPAAAAFNLEEVRDFMPQMGPLVGYAVTVVIEPSNAAHKAQAAANHEAYRQYVAETPGPKVVVVQDLDKPQVIGSFWGEVNSGIHRALGCVGTIIDGAIRDVDEMTSVGFKALARRLCVGHAHVTAIRWNCDVEVFGRRVQPGDLIHGDKHGFLVIPPAEQLGLLEAARFMDANECQTVIPAARGPAGRSTERLRSDIDAAVQRFAQATQDRFGRSGEWAAKE